MIRLALIAALAAASVPAAAQEMASPHHVTLEQETALRCSAVFAIVGAEQARKDPVSASLPRLGNRGREYFVRTTARLMDESGATREHVKSMFRSRYEQVRAEFSGARDPVAVRKAMMEPCMNLLEMEVPAGSRR